MSSLELRAVCSGYGGVDVVRNVDMDVRDGQITCLLGSNGAGKTTIVKSIFGLVRPHGGSIVFDGVEICGKAPHQIVRLGIACVPEGRRVFSQMTVYENLLMGAFCEKRKKNITQRMANVFDLFPRLRERTGQLAGTMSGGEQAMLSIGRGLMSSPKMLVIDEPSLGLAPKFVDEDFEIIKGVKNAGVTVLLVEQNMKQTFAIADYGYLLAQGAVVAAGTPSELMVDAKVVAAYF